MVTSLRFLALVLLLAAESAWAGGACGGSYEFRGQKTEAVPPAAPGVSNLGVTYTAKGCLEHCMADHEQRVRDHKTHFHQIDYTCRYKGRTINEISRLMQ